MESWTARLLSSRQVKSYWSQSKSATLSRQLAKLDLLFRCLYHRICCLILHSSTKSSIMIVNYWMTHQPETCGVCCVLTNLSLNNGNTDIGEAKCESQKC